MRITNIKWYVARNFTIDQSINLLSAVTRGCDSTEYKELFVSLIAEQYFMITSNELTYIIMILNHPTEGTWITVCR